MREQQAFGKNPLDVRDSAHYTEEYIESFVEKWDQLIDWDARAQSESDFFIRLLREHNCEKILDVATGTGFHSVRLMRAGFEVTSVDGSANMLAKAFRNGKDRGFILRTIRTDWRWLNQDVHGKFDAIICLGNSFTHLFTDEDRRKVLAEFYAALRYDGLLILDQRNYDVLLDSGRQPSHAYYYCGENVRAEPEHVDSSLARFRYDFAGGGRYYLNMFPLRKHYVRQLMQEAGFQHVDTYGDFKETYRDDDPDFFIHVAAKLKRDTPEDDPSFAKHAKARHEYSGVTSVAQDYYNSSDADRFYYAVWGGEDIHIGLYNHASDPIRNASRRTVEVMAALPGNLGRKSRVIDLGAGYGGAARYLARTTGCHVDCLNLSEVQNERNRRMSAEQGLAEQIEVVDGTFEDLPYSDSAFDVVWSQDAFLHSGRREQIMREVHRVLKPGGLLLFTDPMQADDADSQGLQPVLDRIHLDTMGSVAFYCQAAKDVGLELVQFLDFSHQLPRHYQRVQDELELQGPKLTDSVSEQYRKHMHAGLGHWVDAGGKGLLRWGVFQFRKPA